MKRIPRLLYVDDEPFNLELFELTFIGKIEVVTVICASEALKILETDAYFDLVIADLEMPLISGVDFIRQAKILYPQIPFYILSGYDYMQECSELEYVNGFFQKPFSRIEILNLCINIKENKFNVFK